MCFTTFQPTNMKISRIITGLNEYARICKNIRQHAQATCSHAMLWAVSRVAEACAWSLLNFLHILLWKHLYTHICTSYWDLAAFKISNNIGHLRSYRPKQSSAALCVYPLEAKGTRGWGRETWESGKEREEERETADEREDREDGEERKRERRERRERRRQWKREDREREEDAGREEKRKVFNKDASTLESWNYSVA